MEATGCAGLPKSRGRGPIGGDGSTREEETEVEGVVSGPGRCLGSVWASPVCLGKMPPPNSPNQLPQAEMHDIPRNAKGLPNNNKQQVEYAPNDSQETNMHTCACVHACVHARACVARQAAKKQLASISYPTSTQIFLPKLCEPPRMCLARKKNWHETKKITKKNRHHCSTQRSWSQQDFSF